MTNTYRDAHVIKLGGSLIVPNGGIDTQYIKKFCTFIRRQIGEKNLRFFIFVGGGRLARHYRDAGMEVIGHELTNDDLDRLGVHATRLNAHLFRTIFRDLAHPIIIKDYSYIQKPDKPIVIEQWLATNGFPVQAPHLIPLPQNLPPRSRQRFSTFKVPILKMLSEQ